VAVYRYTPILYGTSPFGEVIMGTNPYRYCYYVKLAKMTLRSAIMPASWKICLKSRRGIKACFAYVISRTVLNNGFLKINLVTLSIWLLQKRKEHSIIIVTPPTNII
jgi:hypothetical protein